jgi:hypothetical protein
MTTTYTEGDVRALFRHLAAIERSYAADERTISFAAKRSHEIAADVFDHYAGCAALDCLLSAGILHAGITARKSRILPVSPLPVAQPEPAFAES